MKLDTHYHPSSYNKVPTASMLPGLELRGLILLGTLDVRRRRPKLMVKELKISWCWRFVWVKGRSLGCRTFGGRDFGFLSPLLAGDSTLLSVLLLLLLLVFLRLSLFCFESLPLGLLSPP
ncbi:hypothetical protein B0H63DRAFT_482252 [Podospora didyma]|uniref:Transmembrane protein n=1 Tax=Podospora didyma TaxID=330526 RepID=A0AAE0N9I0_9PEZI|nr:hypothetical protein B0H63DRAFT_490680 [Podospora didyma]KAK3375225.1 hypothetical protein B0H63DRAFT_482252 [Podospora didyma]